MKRVFMLLAAGLAALVLGACTAPGQVAKSPAQAIATVHQQITTACAIVQPTMESMKSMEAGLPADQVAIVDKVYAGTTGFCSAHDSINAASLADFVKTSIPGAIKLVAGSSLVADKKAEVEFGMLAFQTALNAALAQYGAVPATVPIASPAPPSGAAAK